MRLSFLVLFGVTVVFAAMFGLMWAFFAAPNSNVFSEDNLRDLIVDQRDASSDFRRGHPSR